MGTYAWNVLYSKILNTKSRAQRRPTRPRPVKPNTGIWLWALNRIWHYTDSPKASEISQTWQRLKFNHSNDSEIVYILWLISNFVSKHLLTTLTTLPLGKGHIQAVNRHVGPGVISYGQFIFSGVNNPSDILFKLTVIFHKIKRHSTSMSHFAKT